MICACPCRRKFAPHRPGQRYFSPECREAARRARSTLMRLTVDERRLIEGSRKGRKGLVPTRNHPYPGHTPTRRKRMQHEPLLTTSEVAEFLGISEWQVKAWRMQGRTGGPAFIRIGRLVRYLPSDVLSFVTARRRAGSKSRRKARVNDPAKCP